MDQRSKTFLSGLMMGLIVTGLMLIFLAQPKPHAIKLLPPPTPEPLTIHVAGAVANPGVYRLPRGEIVQSAIQAAGGPTQDADLNRINLAAELQDGQQVFVPTASDGPAGGGAAASSQPMDVSARVNINTATAPELERLPGIGPSLAEKIIAFREENGLFTQPEDLLDVSGIGPAKLELIREWIIFSGEP